MYIKMSFTELEIIVKNYPTKLAVLFSEGSHPIIVDQLPEDIEANKPVNIMQHDSDDDSLDDHHWTQEHTRKSYDYYYDCGDFSKNHIENALLIFNMAYESNFAAKFPGDRYPEIHPAIQLLKQALTEAPFAYKHTPKQRHSFFQQDEISHEESNDHSEDEYLSNSPKM